MSNSKPVLYGLKNCDTCKKARNWLTRHQIEHEFIDYREQKIAPNVLKAWGKVIGWDQLINRAGTTWKSLPKSRQNPGSDAEWSLLIREHPAIVRRPVVVMSDQDQTPIGVGFNDKLFSAVFESALQTKGKSSS